MSLSEPVVDRWGLVIERIRDLVIAISTVMPDYLVEPEIYLQIDEKYYVDVLLTMDEFYHKRSSSRAECTLRIVGDMYCKVVVYFIGDLYDGVLKDKFTITAECVQCDVDLVKKRKYIHYEEDI